MSISPEIIWFVIGFVLILVEFAIPGLIVIFFGLGAWVVSFTCWLELTTTLQAQMAVFTVALPWASANLASRESAPRDMCVT